MDSSIQPCKVSANDVAFSRATEEQLTTVWTLNAAEWAKPLSVDDHIKRERTLSQQPAAGDHWETWILTLKTDPEVIVASVETFRREVLVAEQGNIRTEKGYGIASVFTNPKYRGSRIGNLLLQKLQEWLDGEGEGWISVLYSDIGAVGLFSAPVFKLRSNAHTVKTFYARLGWNPAPVRTLQLETDPRLWDFAHEGKSLPLPGFTFIKDEAEIRDLCEQDSTELSSQLESLTKDGSIHYAFVPNGDMIAWHIKREDLNASLIHGRWKTRFRGVVSASRRAWIIWHFDEVPGKLVVQRIVTLDKDEHERNVQELAALIRFAQWVAKGSGVMIALIWNPDATTVAAAELLASAYDQMRMKVEDRQGSLAAVRRRFGEPMEGMVWDANEYYAWC